MLLEHKGSEIAVLEDDSFLLERLFFSIKLSSFTAVQTKDGNMWNDFKK